MSNSNIAKPCDDCCNIIECEGVFLPGTTPYRFLVTVANLQNGTCSGCSTLNMGHEVVQIAGSGPGACLYCRLGIWNGNPSCTQEGLDICPPNGLERFGRNAVLSFYSSGEVYVQTGIFSEFTPHYTLEFYLSGLAMPLDGNAVNLIVPLSGVFGGGTGKCTYTTTPTCLVQSI